MPQLAFKKVDDESTTLGGSVNQTPSGRIVNIMVLDLVPHCLELWDVDLYLLDKKPYVKLEMHQK